MRDLYKHKLLPAGLAAAIPLVILGALGAAGVEPFHIDANGNVRFGADAAVTGQLTVDNLLTARLLEAGSLSATGKLTVKNGSEFSGGQHYFQDSENAGRLRVGAAWGFPGIYAEDGGDLVVGASKKVHLGSSGKFVIIDSQGNVGIPGELTYHGTLQVNDEDPQAYPVAERYHLTLSARYYGGTSRRIPQDTLLSLCGDVDGCQVRLGMTHWSSDIETETASRSALFYYASNGRWRASSGITNWDPAGEDNNRVTQHVLSIWDTCFFTDGHYRRYGDQGDNLVGMELLVWNGNKNPSRTCQLTLID